MMKGLKLFQALILILVLLFVADGLLRLLKVGAPLWVVLAVGFLAWLVWAWTLWKAFGRRDD